MEDSRANTPQDAKRDNPKDIHRDTHWILIRGLARESRHWGTFPENLERVMSEVGGKARVDALDLPGTGRYSEMRCPTSIPAIATFARSKFLEIRQRQRESGVTPARETYLVSMSLGGMVGTSWLERWPDDFAGSVLINTSFKGFSPIYHRLRPPSLRNLFGIVRAAAALEREKLVLDLISNRPEVRERVAEEWARIALDRPVNLENFARQLIAAGVYEPSLRRPPSPVLVLSSEKDRMVSPACSEKIALRWSADIRRHPTAGHDLPLDEEAWCLEQIKAWFIRQTQRRPGALE